VGTVDDYLAGLDPDSRAALEHVRALAMEVVPEAEQGTSYGMPALKVAGRPLLAVARTKTHLSIYPFSGRVVDQVRPRLPGYSLSSGTIRFSAEQPLPDDVVRDVVWLRLEEIEERRPRSS
jgi:uncharacterized protein YdhG (YjbR/CyaY superfamily)